MVARIRRVSKGMKIKYHMCNVCGQKKLCEADYCLVPDDQCGGTHAMEFPLLKDVG